MLSPARQPHRRGHRHKRSAAISGDFDAMGVDFFKSNQQTIKDDGKDQPPKGYSFGAKRSSQTQPPPSLVITDENNQNTPSTTKQYNYDIPEAIIDLDKAQELVHDPSHLSSAPRKKLLHRRTESAPELEDFLKFKVFDDYNNTHAQTPNNDFTINEHTNTNNKHSNSAIFEEDEEDDESLNSNNSTNFKLQTPTTINSAFNTPSSTKNQQPRRGGANAARYQYYYKNSLALSNALKSSESLSQITNTADQSLNNKSSISSFQTSFYKNQILASTSSSITSSSVVNSPSRFKFESRIYDMPDKDDEKDSFTTNSKTTTNISSPISTSSNTKITSPTKRQLYIHKKSTSLLSSINLKIRRNSTVLSNSSDEEAGDQDVQEEEAADKTLTPSQQHFNFGEPGPELDLVTMTPKLQKKEKITHHEKPHKDKKSNHKKFFNWLKK